MAPFASLPMYDWPEVSGSWDRLWTYVREGLKSAGILAEERLRRGDDFEALWTDPALCLGQTCGWPLISMLGDRVTAFARFDFACGEVPGDYRSVFIAGGPGATAEELLVQPGAMIAVNGFDSQSGFRALSNLASADITIPASRFLVTGGHRQSIHAVAQGRAQLAAIDGQTWRLAKAHESAVQKVRVLGLSPDVPGLPLIVSPGFSRHVPSIFDALEASINALDARDRSALGIAGLVWARTDDYKVLLRPPFGRVTVGT
jgi:ABC-type phosphate/phosphonate transport system substrate-binding protein